MRPAFFALALLAYGAALGAGCGLLSEPEGEGFRLVSRNLDPAADLDALVGVSAGDLPARTAAWYADALGADPLGRAGRVAQEIAEARPDAVALQGVALFRTQTPGDFGSNPTPNATRIGFDVLGALLDSLAARGQPYRVAVQTVHQDTELPALLATGLAFDVRLTLSAVVLVREGLAAEALPQGPALPARQVTIGGRSFGLAGGLAAARVALPEGARVVVASALLDPSDARVQAEGAEALAALLSQASTETVVLGGTLAAPGSQAYALLTRAGYTDAWARLRPGDPGPTCCSAPDFRAEAPALSVRSDLVLGRGPVLFLEASRIGVETRARSGLRPSRRAGLAVTARVGG